MRRTLPAVLIALASLAAAPAAPAAELPAAVTTATQTLTAPQAAERICLAAFAPRARRGLAVASYVAPITGYLTVRGTARSGDWDLALYDRATRRGIAASQGWGAREVVQTWVTAGQRLTVAGCRRSGGASRFAVKFSVLAVDRPQRPAAPASRVDVEVPDAAAMEKLLATGVDVTHNIHGGHADVLADATQLAELREARLEYEVRTPDLDAAFRRAREADARAAARGPSPTPTGRTTYRQYEDFGAELKQIADKHPSIARPMKLPKPSFQGRELSGIEIAEDVKAADGRPVALIVALHHAREWPSAEAAMEFAHELVQKHGKDERVTRLLKTTRVVIVPLINPDGYISSRTTSLVDPSHNLYENGIDVPLPLFGNLNTFEGVMPPGGLLSFRRKNCNGAIPSPLVPCELQYGVDPNRNYGQFWGGVGSSGDPLSQSYRGTGPWSEPETQGVHEYSQRTNVNALVTIHNVAALVLRPPGTKDGGMAPDEALLKEVGDRIGDATGYRSQFGYQLYDTSGTTEDWNYAAAGTFGYTIEMGPKDGEFHMPYATGFIKEWTGEGATAGRGMREGLLVLAEAAADPRVDAVLTGRAPAGRTLRLRKDFKTQTKEHCSFRTTGGVLNIGGVPCQGQTVPAMEIPDFLEYTTTVPASGVYEWHVTPSTRPFVLKAGGRETWTLTCLDGGRAISSQPVSVERGQRVEIDLPCGSTLPAKAAPVAPKAAPRKKSSRRAAYRRCVARANKSKSKKRKAAARKRCARRYR